MTRYKVGGVSLVDTPIMIGAGAAKTPAMTEKWLKVTATVSGSYVKGGLAGNEGKVLYPESEEVFRALGRGFNWYGMPNIGNEKASKELSSIDVAYPLIVSIAGFSVDDYHAGIVAFRGNPNVSAIEMNLGCPNISGHGRIMSFDLDIQERLIQSDVVKKCQLPIWVKFSPYSDPMQLKEVASIVNGSNIKAVVTCNTFPNAYAGKGNIDSENSLAGMSGPILADFSMGQLIQFRDHLDDEIDVINVGGIATGNDIVERLDIGAAAVQLTSMPHWSDKPGEFWERLTSKKDGDRLNKFLTDNS